MRKGTQEELDLARQHNDATLIPLDAYFRVSEHGDCTQYAGMKTWRDEADNDGRPRMVWMVFGEDRTLDAHFMDAGDLEVFED